MIIAFGHARRRGKDTCAKFMETFVQINHPKTLVRKHSFADSLKGVAHVLYGWAGLHPGIYYENHPEHKETILTAIGKSPRDIWIDLGNAIRNGVWADTFCAMVLEKCKQVSIIGQRLDIITDLRYPNEFRMIKCAGGICIKVDRPGLPTPTDVADAALLDCDGWDYVIQNEGSLVDLNRKVSILMEKLWTTSQKH